MASSILSYRSFHFTTRIASVRSEEHVHPVVIIGVAFFFEQVELTISRADGLGSFIFLTASSMQQAARKRTSGKLDAMRPDFRYVEDHRPAACPVNEIDDIVERGCERVDVLTVERRHEGPVDPLDDVAGQVVTFVLDDLDFGDFGFELDWVLERLDAADVAEPVSLLASSANMS